MKKVCLILGAGDSVEFGAPSTEDLTTLIEKRLEDDKRVQGNHAFATYQLIKGKLQEFLVKPGTLHFEHIYHCIHELLQFSYEDKKEALKHSSSPSGRRQMDGGQVPMHPIVTGLDKLSRIQSIPFNYYYSMLPRDLFSSDLVILAGYGMSDLHINTWLTQARVSNPNQRLVIIDCMNENDPYFSSSRKSIEWVHSLRVKAAEPCVWKKGKNDGWLTVANSKAAVWIKGFQSFLTDSSYCETLHELQVE